VEADLDKRYQTLVVLWFGLLMSVAMYFLVSLIAPAINDQPGNQPNSILVIALMVLGFLLVILSFAVKSKLLGRSVEKQDISLVQKSLVINHSPEELYRFWHNFENLPRFMYHLESVQPTGDRRSHWVVKGPAGTMVEWDAEITEDRPNELIAWRSLEGSDVNNQGVVRFERAPGNRGTIVRVEIEYNPPGGIIGATIAKLFGKEPGQQVQDDLRRFKQLIETGEVVQSDASIHWAPHPAQPPARVRGAAAGR